MSARPTRAPILEVTGLEVAYGKVSALRGASMTVSPGQIVTIIGANGAGKSTLLNAIMGALPATGRSQGSVRLRGERIDGWPIERRVGQGLALVPESRDLFATMTVEDNLLLGGFRRYRAREAGWAQEIERVYEIFPRLQERARQAAGTLSGGERQMLAIGRALMARPSILMLDEPSLGLAPKIVREILRIVASLRETDVALVVVEQNARAALQIADHGYVLETGDVILQGPSAMLAQDPRIIESYLGVGRKRATADGSPISTSPGTTPGNTHEETSP
jgi:branched-chain amino acid transport system ATP-binding protein